MHVTANPPPSHGKVRYVVDRLADQLRRNSAPPLDDLLVLSPDEPLADDCGRIRQYMTTGEHADWWKMASALRAKYSGFQVSPPKREEMKYGNPPTDDAPLRDFVRARISHAKALWSRDVEGNWTSLQFSDWLRLHCKSCALRVTCPALRRRELGDCALRRVYHCGGPCDERAD